MSKRHNNADCDKFFKRGDGKDYILMSTDFSKMLPKMSGEDLISVFEEMFEKHCDNNTLEEK